MRRILTASVAVLVVALAGCASSAGIATPSAVARSSATALPPPTSPVCHPAQVLPFECGTYRSVFGAKSITGDAGGPAKDPLTVSFEHGEDGLTLRATSTHCFEATIPVAVRGDRLVRRGTPTYGEGTCHGQGADRRSWAYAFLNDPLVFEAGGGLVFNLGTAMVTFEYLGVTPLGGTPIERNDLHCIAAHIAPFSCGPYRSVAGTGTLAFLAARPYRLTFEHINGDLTATLDGRCNALSPTLELDGSTVVAMQGASTSMACGRPRASDDDAVLRFFVGTLRYRVRDDAVTFASATSSATFRRG